MKLSFSFLFIFLCATFARAEKISITDAEASITAPGEYEIATTVTRLRVDIDNSIDPAILYFSDTTGHCLIGKTGDTSSEFRLGGIHISDGNVVLDINKGVIVKVAPNNTVNTYASGLTFSAEKTEITIQGEGTFVAYGNKGYPAIGLNNGGTVKCNSLTIRGSPMVFLATNQGVSTVNNVKTINLEGGIVRCYNLTDAVYPSDIKSYTHLNFPKEVSLHPPVVADEINVTGGALLGKWYSKNAINKNPIKSIDDVMIFTGKLPETTKLTWTSGSFLTSDNTLKILEVNTSASTIPGACITFDGKTPCTGTFPIDTEWSPYIYIPQTADYYYANASQKAAVELFGVTPVPTATGMSAQYDFGFVKIGPDTTTEAPYKVQFTLHVRLPSETNDTKDFAIKITKTSDIVGDPVKSFTCGNVTFHRDSIDTTLFTSDPITIEERIRDETLGTRTFSVSASAPVVTTE